MEQPLRDRTRRLARLLGILLWGGIACCVSLLASRCEGGPLLIDIDAASFQSRTNGPIPLRLQIQWDSPKLAKGTLRIDFETDGRHLATYKLENFILNSGRQEQTLLVSPFPLRGDEVEAEVRFTFITDREVISLDPALLRLPGATKRTFLIGTIQSPVRRDKDATDFGWLGIENYMPEIRGINGSQRMFQSLLSRLEPDRLSADPNQLTPYDIVCLPARETAELDVAQGEALVAWVEAGGVLLVQLDPNMPLAPRTADLLNRLAGRPRFLAGPDGRLHRGDDETVPEREFVPLSRGWGRAGVLIGPMPQATDVPAEQTVRKMIAWIWRLSAIEGPRFLSTGRLGLPETVLGRRGQRLPLTAINFDREPWRIPAEFLFPPSIRPVPGWLLATILIGFVLLIGPGDYFLLGAIRRHRWTWVLLPLVTLGVTRLVIATSNQYLGTASRLSTVEIRDLAPDNRIARVNRLDFHVPAERGVFEVETSAGQLVPFVTQTTDDQTFRGGFRPNAPGRVPIDRPQAVAPDILIARSKRQMTVPVERWTPVLFRTMTILPLGADSSAKVPAGFDWDKAGEWLRQTNGADALATAVRAAYGPSASIECFPRDASPGWHPSISPELQTFQGPAIGGLIPRSPTLRRYFDESAPSGSPTFEDLELFQEQPGVPGGRDIPITLQVVVREKDRTVVYRRRYARAELFGPDTPVSPAL